MKKTTLFKPEMIGKSDILSDKELPIQFDPSFDLKSVTKIPLRLACANYNQVVSPPWLQDENAYILKNLLTKRECQEMINVLNEYGFKGLGNGVNQYPSEMRNNKRIRIMSKMMSAILESRIFPFMKPILEINKESHTLHKARVHHGTWKRDAINPLIRFYRYDSNNKFLKHCDFGETPDPLCYRTFVTCLIYLNNGGGVEFNGGATRLFHDYNDGTIPKWTNYASVVPEAGMCLVFNQNMMHDGENVMVKTNPKYCLRSDILYSAVEIGELTEKEKKAQALYYRAMELENEDEEQAAKLFIQAQEIVEDVNYLCS